MATPLRFRAGQYVWTWFDTGALGMTRLYGRVKKAGPRQFTVEWESGATNRIPQGNDRGVALVSTEERPVAVKAMTT